MNTIEEIEQQIIEEFSNFDEWMDKYAYIIELGNDCPMIDEKDKVEKNLIKGCQSKVWVSAKMSGHKSRQRCSDNQRNNRSSFESVQPSETRRCVQSRLKVH